MTNPDSVLKSRCYFTDKDLYNQGCGFPSGHVQLWKLDRKEGRTPKNGCLLTVVLEKAPESLLDSTEIKPVNLKGNQPWILVRRTDAEDEAPIIWSSDVNSQLTGKAPDAGKDWGQKEKRVSEGDGWMASLMQWTWNWANFGRWWGMGRPSVLQSPGSQRVGHWVTEQQPQHKSGRPILYSEFCQYKELTNHVFSNQHMDNNFFGRSLSGVVTNTNYWPQKPSLQRNHNLIWFLYGVVYALMHFVENRASASN